MKGWDCDERRNVLKTSRGLGRDGLRVRGVSGKQDRGLRWVELTRALWSNRGPRTGGRVRDARTDRHGPSRTWLWTDLVPD